MTGLTAFWIKPAAPHGPLGIGVTARSLEDALAILRATGLGEYVPEDLPGVGVTPDIQVEDLDQYHVVPNMAPIVVRGIWYPRLGIGVPGFVEERMREGAA